MWDRNSYYLLVSIFIDTSFVWTMWDRNEDLKLDFQQLVIEKFYDIQENLEKLNKLYNVNAYTYKYNEKWYGDIMVVGYVFFSFVWTMWDRNDVVVRVLFLPYVVLSELCGIET